MVDTAASAIPGDRVLDFPAALYTSGTTEDPPAPTSRKPNMAVAKYGSSTAISRPVAVKAPLSCNTFLAPKRVVSQSAIKRKEAIVLIKAAYPIPAVPSGALITFLKYTPLQSNMVPSQIIEQKAIMPSIIRNLS